MAYAAVAHVLTHSSGGGDAPASAAIDTTGADLLVAAIAEFNSSVVVPVDSQGNTWHPLTRRASAANNLGARLFWASCSGKTSAAHTFHTSGSSGSYPGMAVAAFSGSSASPFDLEDSVGGASNSATSLQPGSITPSADNELVITGIVWGANISGISASGSTVTDTCPNDGTTEGVGLAYAIQTTAAAYRPTWSWTTLAEIAATSAAFRAAGPPQVPTRFYLPSSGAAAVTPAVGTGWTNTASFSAINSLFQTDVARIGSSSFAKTAFGLSASETILNAQYVSKPLAEGQVLSGTVSGQASGDTESFDPANSVNIAVAIRVVKRDGSDYSPIRWLVGPTPAASVSTSTPPCLNPGVEKNRSYRDSSDSLAISYPPSAVTTVAGDRLVFEIGSKNVATADYIFIRGDGNATDLPVDDTTTTRYNPWIEFSQTITFEAKRFFLIPS